MFSCTEAAYAAVDRMAGHEDAILRGFWGLRTTRCLRPMLPLSSSYLLDLLDLFKAEEIVGASDMKQKAWVDASVLCPDFQEFHMCIGLWRRTRAASSRTNRLTHQQKWSSERFAFGSQHIQCVLAPFQGGKDDQVSLHGWNWTCGPEVWKKNKGLLHVVAACCDRGPCFGKSRIWGLDGDVCAVTPISQDLHTQDDFKSPFGTP